MFSYNKKYLEDKWIKSKEQNIIYNDGCMIEWWGLVDENMKFIHQADDYGDNYICIEIKNLIEIVNQIKNKNQKILPSHEIVSKIINKIFENKYDRDNDPAIEKLKRKLEE